MQPQSQLLYTVLLRQVGLTGASFFKYKGLDISTALDCFVDVIPTPCTGAQSGISQCRRCNPLLIVLSPAPCHLSLLGLSLVWSEPSIGNPLPQQRPAKIQRYRRTSHLDQFGLPVFISDVEKFVKLEADASDLGIKSFVDEYRSLQKYSIVDFFKHW